MKTRHAEPAWIPTMLFELGPWEDRRQVIGKLAKKLIREVLDESDERHQRQAGADHKRSVMELLELMALLRRPSHGKASPAERLQADVRRAEGGLKRFDRLLANPGLLIAPVEAARFRSALKGVVDGLAAFHRVATRRHWADLIRAQVTAAMRKSAREFDDRSVGELVGIVETLTARSSQVETIRSVRLMRSDEGAWRRRWTAAQKQWRLRHRSLVAAVVKARTDRAMAALDRLTVCHPTNGRDRLVSAGKKIAGPSPK